MIKLRLVRTPIARDAALLHRLLDGMDFAYVSCMTIFNWHLPRPPHATAHASYVYRYRGPGFGGGFDTLGWFAAFKGQEGHRHVVHRRWLEYGPWRLIRRPDDVSVVEFHDPQAEEFEALEQAKPGHERLWDGFITKEFVFAEGRDFGFFNKRTRTLTRTVPPGVEIDRIDAKLMAAVRNFQRLEVGVVDHVEYVFLLESDARAHLHMLWLHGHGCRTFVDGLEVDLTESYQPPPPQPPAWVTKLQT